MAQTENRAKFQQSNAPKEFNGQKAVATSVPATMPPPGNPLTRSILRGAFFVAATAASAVLGLAVAMMIPLPTGTASSSEEGMRTLGNLWQTGFQYQVGRPVNILVMGIDQVPGAKEDSSEIFQGRSDTMLLLRVDPTDDSVSLLSIPRDTQVEIPGVGVTKINDANVQGGASLAARTVSSTLNGVQIDRYVRVSTDAFRELVDLLGGVEVYVPAPMSYEDNTQKLKIQLSPGLQTLNGNQAEQFARFRQDAYGDIGRVQRQQTLLKALLKRVTSPTVIPRLPSLVSAMRKYVDTNLSPEEMLALVGISRQLSKGDFKMVMLPGRFSDPGEFVASYWIMDLQGRDRVMQQYFSVDPINSTDADTFAPAFSLRIAVQNAAGQPDAASRVMQELLNLGFDNVYLAPDWADSQSQTQIIVQRGDLSRAKDLQKMLGFGKIEANSTGDLDSDVTIRVGRDWIQRAKKQ